MPGAVDVHLHQVINAPRLHGRHRPRGRAAVGLTQQDVANSLSVSLSGSGRRTQLLGELQERRQLPGGRRRRRSTASARWTSCNAHADRRRRGSATPQLLGNLATHQPRRRRPGSLNHYNVQPVFDVYANVQGATWAVSRRGRPRSSPKYRGADLQGQHDHHARPGREHEAVVPADWAWASCFAVLLVYLLMVVNFQTWLDPFIILTALPGALAGIVWMLFVTRHDVQRAGADGRIMAIGVATANSILMVTFANEQRAGAGRPRRARRRARRRPDAAAAGADDGAGDDHRHAADVAGPGRRRRAERPAGPGGDRRAAAWRRSTRCSSCRWCTACCSGRRRHAKPSDEDAAGATTDDRGPCRAARAQRERRRARPCRGPHADDPDRHRRRRVPARVPDLRGRRYSPRAATATRWLPPRRRAERASPRVIVVRPEPAPEAGLVARRHHAGDSGRDHLRPHQRLSQQAARGHRRPREGGPAARRDRVAGGRPATAAGQADSCSPRRISTCRRPPSTSRASRWSATRRPTRKSAVAKERSIRAWRAFRTAQAAVAAARGDVESNEANVRAARAADVVSARARRRSTARSSSGTSTSAR